MSNLNIDEELLDKVADICVAAGDKILEIYNSDEFDVTYKTDRTPVTKADIAAHQYILKELKKISGDIEVISEEDDNNESVKSSIFWMVDPIDGTKEFIKKNGEFTVNIGLVKDGRPVLGVVHAPAIGTTYLGGEGLGAYKTTKGKRIPIKVSDGRTITSLTVSRSHLNQETEDAIKRLGKEPELIRLGSSLKICLVAEGKVDLYPRLAPTHEWDIAAGDAVLRAGGGKTIDLEGNDLKYGKETLLNPFVIFYNDGMTADELLKYFSP